MEYYKTDDQNKLEKEFIDSFSSLLKKYNITLNKWVEEDVDVIYLCNFATDREYEISLTFKEIAETIGIENI